MFGGGQNKDGLSGWSQHLAESGVTNVAGGGIGSLCDITNG